MKYEDFSPNGEFEMSVFTAAKEAEKFFVAAEGGVWEILPKGNE